MPRMTTLPSSLRRQPILTARGEGEPTEDIRRKMEEEYGFNHQAMLDIPDADEAHKIASSLSQQGGELGLRRLLDTIVDDVHVASEDGGEWVTLTKRVKVTA